MKGPSPQRRKVRNSRLQANQAFSIAPCCYRYDKWKKKNPYCVKPNIENSRYKFAYYGSLIYQYLLQEAGSLGTLESIGFGRKVAFNHPACPNHPFLMFLKITMLH